MITKDEIYWAVTELSSFHTLSFMYAVVPEVGVHFTGKETQA